MKKLLGLVMVIVLACLMVITPVMASEDVETLEQESEEVVTVGAEEDTEEQTPARGILGYVIMFALALGVSLLRPFLMKRSLRTNYYDERAWGLDKHRKF